MTQKPRLHSRSPERDSSGNVKRLKTSHPSGISLTSTVSDPASAFHPGVLDHSNIARLNTAYRNNDPFHYALVEKLFDDDLLKNVKEECLSELSFTEKETDIYKVRYLLLFYVDLQLILVNR